MISNIEKEKILMCSFLNKKQISELMEGTHQQATKIFNLVREQTEKEGKLLPHHNKVSKNRVVKILEINEEEIHRNAELERKINKELNQNLTKEKNTLKES